ncbi:transglutaminase TgpA family protein [Undibacterium sp. Ji22W]|uniref:transglutaminase TgpA family protein n=1 Tax=Undibacterium sp. Ji22W TaxID=3413038 RepID=UPI003BF20F49
MLKTFHQRMSPFQRPKMSDDKRNTLLLVVSCFLVLSTHVGNLFIWISVSSASLMLWRAFLTLRGLQLPSRWLLLPIALTLMAGIFWQFRSFFGRETGVAMLAILLSCKMLEMHAKRDLFVILFLGFFLLITSFFESQSIVRALHVSLAVFMLLLAQITFQFHGKLPRLWQRAKLLLLMLSITLPLTVFGFFLFPRIQGPLWGLPSDADVARSGLSDSMTPGNISKLAMSEELVFRAKFLDKTPEKSELYWRAIILDQFDGRRWTQSPNARISDTRDLLVFGNPITQEITLEPSNSHFLFGVDSVLNAPQLDATSTSVNQDGELFSSTRINTRIRYQVVSYPNYRLDQHATAQLLRKNLRLPANLNPRTRDFAENIQTQYPHQDAQVNAVLNFFRTENFFYTLEPPLLARDSVDDFLFNTRSGFCEHYSSAFVVLMRAMNIPARVVTGYQGGTRNTQDNFYEIRQSDAHAWAEIWMPERGWIRVDPTAAVAPERILKNLQATQLNKGLAGLVNSLMKENAWSKELAMRWSALNNTWNQWVLNYNQTQQIKLLDRLGLNGVDWAKTLMTIFVIGLIVIAALAIPLLPKFKKLSPHDSLYLRLCAKLSKQGIPRAISEGPSTYLRSLEKQIDQQRFLKIREFIQLYTEIRYGKHSNADSLHQSERTTKIQRMRALLKHI